MICHDGKRQIRFMVFILTCCFGFGKPYHGGGFKLCLFFSPLLGGRFPC